MRFISIEYRTSIEYRISSNIEYLSNIYQISIEYLAYLIFIQAARSDREALVVHVDPDKSLLLQLYNAPHYASDTYISDKYILAHSLFPLLCLFIFCKYTPVHFFQNTNC
jgi:hypothetical protein